MATITITRNVREGKFWGARLLGESAQYGFGRRFIDNKRNVTHPTFNPYWDIELTIDDADEGNVYEFCAETSKKRPADRWFAIVRNGELVTITAAEARAAVKS